MYVYKWSQNLMYKNNVLIKEKKRYILSLLHPSKQKCPILTLPLRMTTLISKTTSPFCHEWQRKKVSSRHLIGRASISISIIVITIIITLILKSEVTREGGEGVASGAKPPIDTCRRTIRSIRTFTWYNSIESVSRRTSMRCSCAMMSLKVTSPKEDGGADVDGAEWDGAEREGGAAESDCLDWNWASLRLTVA